MRFIYLSHGKWELFPINSFNFFFNCILDRGAILQKVCEYLQYKYRYTDRQPFRIFQLSQRFQWIIHGGSLLYNTLIISNDKSV